MPYRTSLFGLFAAVALSACKVEITVPQGGSVTTESGTYTCNEGQTCIVDVVDLFFDETFIANPRAGYEFIQWKKKQGGFCGQGPSRFEGCRLYTSLFKDFPELRQFLSRDDTFFLEPVFRLIGTGAGSGTGGSGNGSGGSAGGGSGNGSGSGTGGGSGSGPGSESATVCYDRKMFNRGYRAVMRYRTTDETGTTEFRYDTTTRSTAQASDGRSGTKLASNVQGNAGGQSFAARSDTFVTVDNARSRTTTFAIEVDLVSPQQGKVTTIHNPGILTRFDLNKGQSFSQSYTTKITTRSGGFNSTDSTQTDRRMTYLGIDSVTVPAGTFRACKFSEQDTVTGQLGPIRDSGTVWYGVGTGHMIKQVSTDTSSVLLSGTINGKPVK